MKRYIIPALYTIVVFLVLFLIFDKTQVSEIVESIIIGISLFNKSALYILSGILILAIFIIVYLKKISIKNLYFIGYILVFVAILLLPSFVSIFNIEKNTNLNEKRKLAEMPELNLSKDFAQKYEEYYNDNFGLRSSIIKWSGRFKMGVLKYPQNPSP